MALIRNTWTALLFTACLLSVASAKSGFLRNGKAFLAQRLNIGNVQQEVEEALIEAMGHGHGLDGAQLEAKTAQIRHTLSTMPKNLYGRVGRDAMH